MIKILFFLIISFTFSKNDTNFLASNIQKVNFIYETHLQDTIITNDAEVVYNDFSFRFENHEILLIYHDNIIQTYNKKFNQIIIEKSETLLFNIIIEFLKKIKNEKFNLLKNKSKILDYKIGNYDTLLDFKNGTINSVSINIDDKLIVAHSIQNLPIDSSKGYFQINRPGAFIIDLRE